MDFARPIAAAPAHLLWIDRPSHPLTAVGFMLAATALIAGTTLLAKLAAAIAVPGALIPLRPGAGSFAPRALVALAAAAVIGTEITLLKFLAERERPFQILLTNNSVGLGLATLAAVCVWQWPSPTRWATLAALGLTMAGAQSLNVQALRRADASFVMPFSYAAPVFASLYDLGVFCVRPDGPSVAGAGVIFAGGGRLAWREGQRRLKAGCIRPGGD